MPRKKTVGLTDAELRVMNVLWSLGEGTVAEVQKALTARELAYTTVLTTLQTLERKQYVTHKSVGRTYVYLPAVDRGQIRQRALRTFLATWFDASPTLLVANLLDEAELNVEEVEKELSAAARRRRRK
jgi:predicted transcriptional regulator